MTMCQSRLTPITYCRPCCDGRSPGLSRHAIPTSAVATQKASGEVILPEIAGINLADGLKRVGKNRRLYRDLLVQFAATQGEAAAEISAALETGDIKLAERIAHTVKGVAGNIGITEVQSLAAKAGKGTP